MGMPSRRQALWNVARECACWRADKECKATFGSAECNDCRLYIRNYTDADSADINLLMLHAEESIYALQSTIKSGTRGIVIFISSIVLVIVAMYLALNVPYWNKKPKAQIQAQAQAQQPVKGAVEARQSDDENAVWSTLQKVAISMTQKKDINGDGLVNCIDAALVFYRNYPYKDKVMIYHNYNPAKDFNHLFNLVFINGNWVGVEPQAKFCGYYDTYRMTTIWKGQYDSSKNKNVTSEWR